MEKGIKIASVCKNCGAVGNAKHAHCVYCGAGIKEDMFLYKRKPLERAVSGRGMVQTGKKKFSTSTNLSLIFGILSVFTLANKMFSTVLLCLLAVIFGVVSMSKRANYIWPAAVGLGLGIYTLAALLLWFFYPLLFLF